MTWLLVEDDNDIRNVVSVMMSVWGEKPLAFADGSSAWKWLDSVTDGSFKGELPELALMDIRMPGYTGDKVAARIRQTSALKDIPIILMTAFALSEVEARVMMEQAGVDHLIYKPLPDMDVFKTTLYQVRDQRRTLLANAKPAAPAPAPAATPAPATPPPAPPAPTPAVQSAQPSQPAQSAPPTQPAQPSQPAKPATPAQPAQPAQSAQPAQPAQPAKPAPPASPTQPAQPAKPAPPAPPTQSAQPAKPAQPAQPAQSAQPAQPASPPAPPAASPQPTKQATPQTTSQATPQTTSPKPAAPPTDNKRQDSSGNDRK